MQISLDNKIVKQEFYNQKGVVDIGYQAEKDLEEFYINFDDGKKGILTRSGKDISGYIYDIYTGKEDKDLFREKIEKIKVYLVTALNIPGARQMLIDYH